MNILYNIHFLNNLIAYYNINGVNKEDASCHITLTIDPENNTVSSTEAKVGGVLTNCTATPIGRALTSTEQKKLVKAVEGFTFTSDNPVENINAIYNNAFSVRNILPAKTSDDIIANVRQYLENNCNHPITLDDVANVSGLDKYALCRYFKKHNKRSVMEELLSIRINKAKRLLRYTSENVETICFMCGFESHSYFSLRFREKCGCSPSEYRSKRR